MNIINVISMIAAVKYFEGRWSQVSKSKWDDTHWNWVPFTLSEFEVSTACGNYAASFGSPWESSRSGNINDVTCPECLRVYRVVNKRKNENY